MEGVLGDDGVVELREAELSIVVLVSTTEEGKDFRFSGSNTVFLEVVVYGVDVEGTESVGISNLEEVESIKVITISQVLSEGFSSGGEINFLFEDTGKSVFDFVAEDFVPSDKVGFSLGYDLTEDAIGLWEEDVKELGVGESVISLGVLFLEDESKFSFSNSDLVFSEEVNEVDESDVAEGVTVDSLEGGVWLKSGLFSEDLSDDFDLLFTFSDGLEEISELELSLDAWHEAGYDERLVRGC